MSESLKGMQVGFIGLGLMGKAMAEHLRDAGAQMVIHNRSREVVDELVALGGMEAASSPAEVAEKVGDGIIVLCLTRTGSVEDVIGGGEGLLAKIVTGSLVIDMGTTAVKATRRLYAALREQGASLVDAPISGGATGSQGGDLDDHGRRTEGGFCPCFDVVSSDGEKDHPHGRVRSWAGH